MLNDDSKLPRYVLFRGRRARVIGYEEGTFRILDSMDTVRLVKRFQITFIKEKK